MPPRERRRIQMSEIVIFHHAQGLTPGVLSFADELRAAGHTAHTPDLFDGQTFASIPEGVAYAQGIGFGEIIERGARAVADLPTGIVYLGFSLGVVPAQYLAQTRAGARGAIFAHSCIPVSEFGDAWPVGVPVQIHAMDADPYFVDEGDLEAAQALVASTPDAALLLYPGREHLFVDSSLPSFDPAAAALFSQRVITFLA